MPLSSGVDGLVDDDSLRVSGLLQATLGLVLVAAIPVLVVPVVGILGVGVHVVPVVHDRVGGHKRFAPGHGGRHA